MSSASIILKKRQVPKSKIPKNNNNHNYVVILATIQEVQSLRIIYNLRIPPLPPLTLL